MRILLASYWPFPHIGGVWTYVDTLRTYLEEMGHEVEIFGQHPDLTKFYLLKSGREIEKAPLISKVEPTVVESYKRQQIPITPWITWREIEKYVFESICSEVGLGSFDLIHTQDIFSTFTCARVKPPGLPQVATIHGCLATEWIANGEMQTRTRLEEEYLALDEYYGAMSPDCLILPSNWLSEQMTQFQVSHPRTSIIPCGIDLHTFTAKVQQGGDIPDHLGKKVIACPARLVAVKGQAYLLEAISLLVQKHEDVICWLIGDGVLRRDLEIQVDQLGLHDYVRFLGDRNDVAKLLSVTDIVVLPSLQDNFPFAIIEAQALGKPVVGSSVGGIQEMIEHGKNGMLVEPKNIRQIFENIDLLLTDKNLYTSQSQAAKRHAFSNWSVTAMVEQTRRVYQDAIEFKRRGQHQPTDFTSSAVIPARNFIEDLSHKYDQLFAANDIQKPSVTILQGKVQVGSTREELPMTNVQLIDITGVVLKNVKTDKKGEYAIHNVQPGNYALTCSNLGYGTYTQKITVSGEESLEFDIHI